MNDEYNGISTGENKDGFIFAGRLEKLKGIEYLLYAWKKMGSQWKNGAGNISEKMTCLQ